MALLVLYRISVRLLGLLSRSEKAKDVELLMLRHRRSVVGVTKKLLQRSLGSNRDKAAGSTRSAGSSLGLPAWRCSTASWWRRTRSSTSFAAPLPSSLKPANSTDRRASR
jgi:hypothetical protein